MSVATTTLQVNFVSESAGNANTFGWYNSVTGLGGILFADVEADGRNAPLTAGISTASFTVNTSDVGNIQFFLISDGADLNSSSELAGPIKVIQQSNGTWAVAQATTSGSDVLDHGQPNVLAGAGVNAMFTETAKNAGGVDYASSVAGSTQTAATLAGDTADGATGVIAWEDLAATRNANGTYSKPGDADYNDAVFKVSIKPTANADTATVSENGPATIINVLANDTDQATGATLHVSSVNTSGLHGTVTIAADCGSISYNPGSYFQYLAAGQTATETFTYTETDQFGGSATASTTVTIVGANDGPTISSATATGAVTEDGSTAASGTVVFKDVDTTDTHTISAIVGGSGYLGTFTLALSNDSTGDGSGSVTWNFAVANSALQFLAAGQALTQTYTVTINDGHGGTVAQNVTVTITGSNDGPCITSGLGFGTVTDNGTLTTAGTLGFIDVDVTDLHTVTATALGSGYVGTLTPVVTAESAGGSGSIAWTYSVDSAAIDFLGVGQTAYQIYKVTVNDGHGGTDSQYVTITLNGSNDAPVVTASSNGSVTEIADNATGENTATLTSNGTVTFVDPDWSDSHTVTVTAQASGYRGSFTASLFADANTAHDLDHDADDVGPGTVKWNFAVNDSSLDFLSAGQTLVQNYNVSIKDNHGVSVTQVVSVTLVGTNDAPTISSAVTSGAVNELADGAVGEYVATLSSSGTIGFKDVDLADSHVISVTPAGGGYVGALTAVTTPDSTGTGAGTVTWTYSVLDGTIDYLAAGQKLTQTYTVAIDDGHGGVVSKAVTITMTGAADVNHAPVIGAGVTSGAIV
jgi:VCBS repeat-containing protein